jgi:hypothetical protein
MGQCRCNTPDKKIIMSICETCKQTGGIMTVKEIILDVIKQIAGAETVVTDEQKFIDLGLDEVDTIETLATICEMVETELKGIIEITNEEVAAIADMTIDQIVALIDAKIVKANEKTEDPKV